MTQDSQHPSDEALIRWVTGELVGDEALAFEAHVGVCPSCCNRLADEAAMDVVLHAAATLDLEPYTVADVDESVAVVAATPAKVPAANNGWRQMLAVAAGFALMLVAGRGALDATTVDSIEADVGGATVIADGPASWEHSVVVEDDPICEATPLLSEDETSCDDDPSMASFVDSLVAMRSTNDLVPWSVMADGGNDDDESCTTPVDTGESLTCDDWLSADDLSG